jgi:phenolic acid decarboxylase
MKKASVRKKPRKLLTLTLTSLLIVTVLSINFKVSTAETATWTTEASLPVSRADLPAVGYNDLVYVFGGYQVNLNGGQPEVYAYNPSINSWTQKASMSYARWGSAAATYNGVAYIFGGLDGANNNKVEAYNFASNTWTAKNDLPDNIAGQGEMAVATGSLIYVFSVTSAYSYNPSTDTFNQLANIPFSSRWGTCASVSVNGENRIYIMGGFDDNLHNAVNTIYYYRPVYNDWTYAGITPYTAYGTLRDNPVINNTIYYGYGHAGSDFFSYLYSFNPSTGVWKQLSSGIYPRDGVACGAVGGKLYVIGGRNANSNPIPGLNYNEQFDTGILTASVSPTQVRMYVNQSQTFTSSVSGGTPPYTYQWYKNGTAIPGATSNNLIFTPAQTGHYNLYVNATDSLNKKVQSNIVNDILVYDQSAASPLVPDWSNVTKDFFNIAPGAINPVLTGSSVTDRPTPEHGVADPFLFHENNTWYMFFEVDATTRTEIGLATSNNGVNWTYRQIVLSEPFDLAYPYLFKWDGTYYLIPETYSQNEVRLYKATNFPYSWTLVSVLISDQSFIPVDSSIFRYNNMWWMFTGDDSNLYLFYSYNLTDASSWHMTTNSPIVANDPAKVRGGGRVIVFDNDGIIRLTQKGDVLYGEAVRAFEVDMLTQTSYIEHEVTGSPIVERSGSGWNTWEMHTVDPWWTGNSWLAVVDGNDGNSWSIGIYVTPLNVTISPTQVRMYVNQSQTFTSSVSGGTPPYTYQWYKNGTAIPGATSNNLIFTPAQTGHYNLYVNATDSLNKKVQSNIVNDILVNNQTSVSIRPVSTNTTLGGSVQLNSTIAGGFSPYIYQWYYNNGTAIAGTATSTLTYKANYTGTYTIYVNVTDSLNFRTQSNQATINVYTQPSVTISPVSVNMTPSMKQQFTSVVTGGLVPYTYQWYVNNTAVMGATSANFTFMPTSSGNYQIYVNVGDSIGSQATSNIASINVYSVHLLLNDEPQTPYAKGQQITFTVTVFNQQNPRIQSFLAITIGGPEGYSYYDFKPINVSANGSNDYSFTWVVPNVAGTYIVETSLVPAQLTAYDAKWINIGEPSTGFVVSQGNSAVISKSLINEVYWPFVFAVSLTLSNIFCFVFLFYRIKKIPSFSQNL